jgi:hypothetical protein
MPAPDSINRTGQREPRESTFRNSATSREGHVPGRIVQGKIVNVNMKNWTVDVLGAHDRKRWFNIQIGSPYQNTFAGEGFFVVPEVGSVCMVALTSDSSAPFLLTFIMPPEKITDTSASDAPTGTRSHGNNPQYPTDVTYAGGRPNYTPGTLGMTGRDGQFVLLHRGGVLQLGASPLAQRIYIPLTNLVMDVSQRYAHHNIGGAILWGMQEGQGQTNFPTTQVQTFRVMANDQYATVRIQRGNVTSPLSDSSGVIKDTVVYEVSVIPLGFNADAGDVASASAAGAVNYRYTIDKSGNVSVVVAGDVFQTYAKTLTMNVTGTFSVNGQADGAMTFQKGFTLQGGDFANIQGKIVRLGAGTTGVARKGDLITIPANFPKGVPLQCMITFPSTPATSGPCTIQWLTAIGGAISTANDAVKA